MGDMLSGGNLTSEQIAERMDRVGVMCDGGPLYIVPKAEYERWKAERERKARESPNE